MHIIDVQRLCTPKTEENSKKEDTAGQLSEKNENVGRGYYFPGNNGWSERGWIKGRCDAGICKTERSVDLL